jgi:oxalate decarboxylase/phosphoglucose isomerase-like protein (cupin superfamily)
MKLHKRLDPETASHEYGLQGWRTTPWPGLDLPFGGAYCIVAPHTDSLRHVNEPGDEDELFICVSGAATVVIGEESFSAQQGDHFAIPRGLPHYVSNLGDEPFHFYALWWNPQLVSNYMSVQQRRELPEWEI